MVMSYARMVAPKAQHLARTLGIRCAAGYLRNRHVSLEEALDVLGMPRRAWTPDGELIGTVIG